MIPTIYIALSLLDALMLAVFIRTRGYWLPKAALMVVVLGFNFMVWSALASFSGWPTTQTPPKTSEFLQASVDENGGYIYLWLVPLNVHNNVFAYTSSGSEPRAYRIPYSEGSYEQILKAQKLQKGAQGQPVILQRSKKSHLANAHGHGHMTQVSQMHAYVLPPKRNPPKRQGQ